MIFKLLCNQDPRALGIENESGAWDLAKFEAHLKSCKLCARGKSALKRELKTALEKALTHGGRRPGAGRKPLGEDKMVRLNVMLENKHIDKAARIGEGNVSRGIRLLIDAEMKRTKR